MPENLCFQHQRSPVSCFLGIGFYFSARSVYLPGCFSSYLSSTFTEAGEGCWYFRMKLLQWSDCGYQVNDNALHVSTKWPRGRYRLAAWWLGNSAIDALRQTGPVIYAFLLDSFPFRADFWNSSFERFSYQWCWSLYLLWRYSGHHGCFSDYCSLSLLSFAGLHWLPGLCKCETAMHCVTIESPIWFKCKVK